MMAATTTTTTASTTDNVCACSLVCFVLWALCYVKNSLQTRLVEQSDDGFICCFSFFPLDLNHSLTSTPRACVCVYDDDVFSTYISIDVSLDECIAAEMDILRAQLIQIANLTTEYYVIFT